VHPYPPIAPRSNAAPNASAAATRSVARSVSISAIVSSSKPSFFITCRHGTPARTSSSAVSAFLLLVADGTADADVRPVWDDPHTRHDRSEAETVELWERAGVPWRMRMKKLGFDEKAIGEMEVMRATERVAAADAFGRAFDAGR